MPNATQSLRWTAAALVLGMFTSTGAGGAEGTPRINIATEILAPLSLSGCGNHPAPALAPVPTTVCSFAWITASILSLTDGFAIWAGVVGGAPFCFGDAERQCAGWCFMLVN